MEEFNWERNMSSFPWNNINNHYQQQHESNLIFDSQNIFLNPVQDLPKPGSTPAIILPSSFGSASQYWRQTINVLHEGKNVIPLTPTAPVTSLESLNHTTTSSYQNVNDVVSSNGFGSDTDDGVESSRTNKRSGSDPGQSTSSAIINFRQATESEETDSEVIKQMKEMIYTAAAFRPVSFADVDVAAEKPRRKNVRISNDPQTVAARKRRERVSEKIRVLQKLVPGGDKMDTASMLDEAANYMKFLRSQVRVLEQVTCGTSCNAYGTSQNVDSNVALGIPFSMQAPFLLSHQQQSCSTTLPPHQH